MKLRSLQGAVLVVLSLALVSFSPVNAQEKAWQDQAELSYVQTGGNTEVITFSGKNTLKF